MRILSSQKGKLKFATIAAIIATSLALPGVTYADIRTKAIVTVYSDGKVMAVYKATQRGRLDNLCYVFNVRKGVRDLEVRVCGTFTVEEVR